MRWALLMLGAAGAFLIAAIIAAALDGPGLPYFLAFGALALLAGLAGALRVQALRNDAELDPDDD